MTPYRELIALARANNDDPCSRGHQIVIRAGWAYCGRPSCRHFRQPLWKAGK